MAWELREVVHLQLNGNELGQGEVTDYIWWINKPFVKMAIIWILNTETITIQYLDSYHTSQRLRR